MNHSDTLELSLQLLRQPSVTPIDHDCQNIMAERLAKVGFKMLIIYGLAVVQKALCSVLRGILMLFRLDNWMHGIQTRFCLASVMVNYMAVVLPT